MTTKTITITQTQGNDYSSDEAKATGETGRLVLSPTFNLADVLPKICSPWFSMGDVETLTRIGAMLDGITPSGSQDPNWDTAKNIAELHHEYTKPKGAYSEEYERCPSGHYAPGSVSAVPVYEGRYDRWNFQFEVVAAVGRKVKIVIGINRAGYPMRTLIVDFGKYGSTNSAGDVEAILKELGIRYESDTIPDEYEKPREE